MKAGLKLLPIGVAAYVLFLVVMAPASKVIPHVQSQLEGVRLAGISGTLWSGRALQVSVPPVQLTQVGWGLKPLGLLLGSVVFELDGQLGGRAVSARASRGLFSGPSLADVNGSVPAIDLMYWAGMRAVELDGVIDFSLDEVEFSGGRLPAVAGRLVWKPAMVMSPIELNLGLAELTTAIESDGLTRGQLIANGGALTLQGEMTLQSDGNYQLIGDVKKTGAVPQAVEKFLSTFAEQGNEGYRLEWSDRIKQ
jgi:general secretion pathway protein N